MSISIIIVNYNVKFFLEQCLYSVLAAGKRLAIEVIVVDNGSTDGSLPYLQPRFPQVQFIESKGNCGFAKACNAGYAHSSGDYVLFLNPDTLLAEDTLQYCITFLKAHASAGAAGVRMIDGGGRFLKESKRAFPSPLTSLFKLAGLSRLFPHSKLFSQYHLGHLPAHKNHQVDVLAGAFMMIKRSVLEKVGLFDEAFFMYGEDVDLSYRIQKSGYQNYYLAGTAIIHFKGESTKRGSLNYVRLFYSAMSKFVQKHYGGSRAKLFTIAIHFAIWLRALLAAGAKAIKWVGLPLMDAALILSSFYLVKEGWANYIKPGTTYTTSLLQISFTAFTLVYLVVAYYAGLYDKAYKQTKVLRTTLLATVVLLALYSLLPEHYRFSRGMVLFGALAAFICMSLLRVLMVNAGVLHKANMTGTGPYLLIAGTPAEYEEIKKLVPHKKGLKKIIGRLQVNEDGKDAIAPVTEAANIATALNAEELIFCAGALSYNQIINLAQCLKGKLRLRFHHAGSGSIVGSDSSTGSGQVLTAISFNIAQPANRRYKRVVDVVAAVALLFCLPILLFKVKKPLVLLTHCMQVLTGHKTWIGYAGNNIGLPKLRKGILAPNGNFLKSPYTLPQQNNELVNMWYAQNYTPIQDIQLLLKNYKRLGG